MARRQFSLLAASAIVIALGLCALALTLTQAWMRLEAADAEISDDAIPSVVALSDARGHLRDVEMGLRDYLRARPQEQPLTRAQIESATAALDDAVSSYLALPSNPVEKPLEAEIRDRLGTLRSVEKMVLASPTTLSTSELDREVTNVVSGLGRALLRGASINAEVAGDAGRTVRAVSHELLPTAFAFEAISGGVALVALWAAYRSGRRAEAALARSNEELDAFAGRIAHDLLSPLQTVNLALDLTERRLGPEGETVLRSTVTRASRSLGRVRALVDDLLAFARAGAKPPPGVSSSLPEIAGEVATELEPIAKGAQVELRVESIPPRLVRASPGVLTSMITNLVQNAIKYTAGGETRMVVLRGSELGPLVRVEVEDTGPGIPLEEQSKLFEPYVRGRDTGAAGLGLGLATVKRLAESHGGRVGVRSAPGRGSLFYFTLPSVGGRAAA